jgi:tRNA A-37 threonylcarbamoyl transferase component Bud32
MIDPIVEIRDELAEQLGIEKNDVRLQPFHTTNNSSLYLASLVQTSQKILVKEVVSDDFETQYESHMRVSDRLLGKNCCVPQPIGVLRDRQMILMQYIDGDDLRAAFLNRSGPYTPYQLVKKAGEWLACFHQSFSSDNDNYHVQEKYDDLLKFRAEHTLGGSLSDTVESAMDWLRTNIKAVSSEKVHWGGFHGDYKPENLLLEKSSGTIYGIDYILNRNNCQIMDLAQFANHLIFICMSRRGIRIYPKRNQLIEEFINAYSNLRGPISKELLLWLRLEHLSRHLIAEYASAKLSNRIQARFLQLAILQLLRKRS